MRQRYDKLEQKDLPAIRPNFRSAEADEDNDNDYEFNFDMDNDNDSDSDVEDVEHVSMPGVVTPFPARRFGFNTVLI